MVSTDQKYRIIEKLDSGGMAEIYRGEAESIQGFKKQIAIKRVLPELARNQRFISMFLDEARLSLYLNHTNIVQVFDIGKANDTYFIVMEFVEGLNLRSLAESLKRQKRSLDISHGLFIMMEICKGLGYAHDMTDPDSGKPLGIVHRDISPPNVLLSKAGEVKLVDFGLAKAANQVESTEPGVVKGKFSYLSPEAASGHDVDHRADIFSCGIILFELLTGTRLFYGESDYETVDLVRRAEIPTISAINPNISASLEQIIHKCLAREPGDRYQHAYEIQDQIAHYLFSRGLKVTNRDIANLVRQSHAEYRATLPPAVKPSTILDQLIQDELLKFTSLEPASSSEPAGAKPLVPDEMASASGPLDPRDFVDTRNWSDDTEDAEQANTVLTFSTPEGSQVPEITSMEEILEHDEGRRQHLSTELVQTAQTPRFWRGLVITLLVLVALSAATIFILHSVGAL